MIKYCGNCGCKIIPGTSFCGNCGTKIISDIDENNINQENKDNNANINQNNKQEDTQQDYEKYEFNCPICNKMMTHTYDEGFLGGHNYECYDCELKFRLINGKFSLHRSPDNTRFNKRYAYEIYSKDEWIKMGKGELNQNEINEINSYEYITDSHYKCPYCHLNFKKYNKKSYLTNLIIYHCDKCKLTFEKSGNEFRFMNIAHYETPLWQYYHKKGDISKWENVLVKKFDISLEEHENVEKYDDNTNNQDIQIFMKNLETENPLLPPLNYDTSLLVDNEKFLYLLKNIELLKGELNTENNEDRFNKVIPINTDNLVITDNRIFFEQYTDELNIRYTQISSLEYLKKTLIINIKNEKEALVLVNIDDNQISFNIGDRHYDIPFTPHMLFNLIKGQVLKDKYIN